MSVVHAPAEPTRALGGTTVTSGHPEPRGTGDTSRWRVALAPGTPSPPDQPAGARSGSWERVPRESCGDDGPSDGRRGPRRRGPGQPRKPGRTVEQTLDLLGVSRDRIGHNQGTERSPSSVRTNRLQSFPLSAGFEVQVQSIRRHVEQTLICSPSGPCNTGWLR